ncbi:MAG: ATP-binding cassette domain-containing protein, partial [Campylobacter sp.]|nr:ATP-binding cassette domain-containing protein [Campylobacter sp.]
MIKIENLHKSFGNNDIIKGVSADIKKGEIFAIVGHSGAGKSTLLRCINGLEDYQSGSVKVADKEVANLKGDEIREFRKNIGMIFQ